MQRIDALHLERPFLGSRRIADALADENGLTVNRKRIRRLMRVMGITALYPKPRLSRPAPGHRIYPYRLRGLRIDQPNQVWASDITYPPMARGFLYGPFHKTLQLEKQANPNEEELLQTERVFIYRPRWTKTNHITLLEEALFRLSTCLTKDPPERPLPFGWRHTSPLPADGDLCRARCGRSRYFNPTTSDRDTANNGRW
ncbi:transposase orfab subunit b [Salinisphaera sp. C84B14]|uniref:IS3 family transposase n=1 Tax=Salinisphaera sp. C84B14 TaxID=1304155 RepID=UPI0033422063